MSDTIDPPAGEGRQLELVREPTKAEETEADNPEIDAASTAELAGPTNETEPEDDSEVGEDNVFVLPGLGPIQSEDWGAFVEEEEEAPFETEAGIGEDAPPSPEIFQPVIEALLLAADGPLSENQLRNYLCQPSLQDMREALLRIQDKYQHFTSGIRLVEVAKGWQIRTDVRCARWVARMRGEKPLRLSKAALETLAIVAYRQPVSRAEIEDLRGVDPGGVLRMLNERGLVAVTGRKDVPGRPLLYGTTNDFLGMFGLRDLSDLPTLRDLRELQQDDPREGIGGTELDYMSTLSEALLTTDEPDSDQPPPTPLHPIPQALYLEPNEPLDEL